MRSLATSVSGHSEAMGLIHRLYPAQGVSGSTGRKYDLVSLSTSSNLAAIQRLMETGRPHYTLEIGLALGGSCVMFAAMHQQLHGDAVACHLAIDPFQSTVWDGVANLKLGEANLAEIVEVIEAPSHVVLPQLLSRERQYGIIYIDGSHLFEDVFIDAYFGMRLLEEDGYLLFDDSTNRHVKKVLGYIESSIHGLRRQPEDCLWHAAARCIGRRQLTVYRRVGDVERVWNSPFREF